MNLTGWVVYNGNLEDDSFVDFANMIEEAGDKQGISIKKIKNNDLLVYLSSDQLNFLTDKVDQLPDFVVFTDKDLYLARQLENMGIPLFNNSYTIEVSDDKIKSYQLLAEAKVPIPETIISPKVYYNHDKIDYSFLKYVIEKLKFPLILKEAFGSFGQQVYLIENEGQLLSKVKKLVDRPILFQQFIDSSYGRDIRLQVVGEEVVTSMLRKSENDFRANISSGGSMEPYKPTAEEKRLAILAAKAVNADFAGVDILFGPNNTPLVCEVNSNAHIRNLYNCTGVNAADYIIKHIKNTLK